MTEIISKIKMKIKHRRNTVAYWRNLGSKIGEEAEIYHSASLGTEPYLITIGRHVRINAGVHFVTHDGGVWVLRGLRQELKDIDLFGPISVGDNVHIGTRAIIMPNVKIGSNCIIGCGAIVTKDIPDNSVAVGIPARVIESIEEYQKKHKNNFDHTKSMNEEEKKQYLIKKFCAGDYKKTGDQKGRKSI